MKLIEKLILCCIWICIAIVAVLIKDQADLNNKIQKTEEIETKTQQEVSNKITLDENAVMNIVQENVPVMNEAVIEFYENGVIDMKIEVNDELIQGMNTMFDHDAMNLVLPILKGMEISCQATLSVSQLHLEGCKAGVFSIPEEALVLVEEKINQTWSGLVEKEGIRDVNVNEQGIHVTKAEE